MADQIILHGIRVMARVGVPEKERAQQQPLEISVALDLDLRQAARAEKLNATLDYASAHQKIIEVVQARPRSLIETVAEDIAQALLKNFKIKRVEVEVHKFILRHTQSVAVRIIRKVH